MKYDLTNKGENTIVKYINGLFIAFIVIMVTHITNIAFFNSAYSGIAMATTVPTFLVGCTFYVHLKLQNKNE